MKQMLLFAFVALLFVPTVASAQMSSAVDTAAASAIRDEALKHSEVMQTLSYLTDVYGPRLTWSPEYKEAAEMVERLDTFATAKEIETFVLERVKRYFPRGLSKLLEAQSA